MAISRVLPWLRWALQPTTMLVGRCVMRMAVSTLFTFWPPFPPERKVSTRRSSGRMLISILSSISGITKTDAKDVWRRGGGCGGGRGAGGLMEGQGAYETVDSGFAREQAVGVFADELNCCGLDAGFFAGS